MYRDNAAEVDDPGAPHRPSEEQPYTDERFEHPHAVGVFEGVGTEQGTVLLAGVRAASVGGDLARAQRKVPTDTHGDRRSRAAGDGVHPVAGADFVVVPWVAVPQRVEELRPRQAEGGNRSACFRCHVPERDSGLYELYGSRSYAAKVSTMAYMKGRAVGGEELTEAAAAEPAAVELHRVVFRVEGRDSEVPHREECEGGEGQDDRA